MMKTYLWVTDPRNQCGARARRATKKLCAGGSAPAPWVTFFARAKKVTKESTPQSLHRADIARSPALLTKPGARITRRALGNAPRARSKVSRRLPAALRCSARDDGRISHPPQALARRCFQVPVAAAEHRSPRGGIQASPCSSRAA